MRINDAHLLEQVVNYLNNHREATRIKKMLYCLCTNRWEKDSDYLNSIDSRYLIEQIYRENDSFEKLKILLQNLIKTVNKPQKYIEVAKIIYLSMGQLYPEFHQEHSKSSSAPAPQRSTPVPPADTYTSEQVPAAFQAAYAPEPTQAYTSQGVPSSLQRAYAPEPTQQYDLQVPPGYSQSAAYEVDESAYETYCTPEAPEDMPFESIDVPEYDPFLLRQNVMSYTNPLRSKIILLIMLRPHFNFGTQSASNMREYHLDDLLLEVIKTYPTIQDLEESIMSAVEQLVEVEEYGKAATGLLQSLVPIYTMKTQGRMSMMA